MRKLFILTTSLFSITIVHAQSKITSASFGMMEARWLGPGTMSGRITALDGVNEDGKTIYVGTAGGGVWKTTNGGASFKPVFDKYCQSIGALAIDQKNPKTIYVGTGESNMRNSVSIGDGMYKTTDGGDNWTKLGLDSTEHISKVVIDPSNSSVIYAAAPGPLWSNSIHRGLYKSTDAGQTWNKILYINEKTGVAEFLLDPSNSNVLYATTWEFRRSPYSFSSGGNGSGMYKSTDGGKTWKELRNGLPAKPFGRVAMALAPSAPNNLIAIVESNSTGLYISSDGGDNWKQQSAPLNVVARPFYFSTIAIDPKDPKRVYRPAYTFGYSSDGGYSFTESSGDGGWVHSDMHALWINPNNTSQIYVGTDGGMYVSLDRGATWTFIQNLPVGQFYHVAVDNASPYRIYGGLQDNGSWVAPSAAPGGVHNRHWNAIYGGDGFWVVPDPKDANIAFAEAQGGMMGRVNLTTLKYVSVKPQQTGTEDKHRWNWNTPIHIGQKNPGNLYTGSQYLFKSTDKGNNWTRISPDLTTNDKKKQDQESSGGITTDNTSAENHCTIFSIAESPVDDKMIWVGTDDGNLHYTMDAGKTWSSVSKNYSNDGIPSGTWVSSIEPSRFNKDVVYATFDNHAYGDHKTYVARSADRGKTWTRLSSTEFTGFAHKIKEDLVNPDLLFLGTEMGLFATVDGGKNWFRMKNRIPEYALVRDIQIHPRTNDLILGTHGRGVIVVDDITPMRALKDSIIDKEVHLFPLRTSPLLTSYFGDGGFPNTGGWNAGNPPVVTPIQYYMKERLTQGDAKVDILDKDGKLVQSFPGSKRKGINKVYWNLRMTPPKVATGGNKLDFGTFTAPMVLPGTYTVRLTVGNKQYNEKFTLVHDTSNKEFTLADRQLQYKVAMDLYRLHEDLFQVVENINRKQAILKTVEPQLKDPAARKLVTDYNTELEKLRATLLATKSLSMFADEVQLREKISEVYGAVTSQESKPSNLQIERVSVLIKDFKKSEQDLDVILKKYDANVKKAAAAEGINISDKVF